MYLSHIKNCEFYNSELSKWKKFLKPVIRDKNLKKYNELANRFSEKNENVSDEDIVNFYVFKLNKYYPVTHGSGSAQNPEESKVLAMKEFQEYVKRIQKNKYVNNIYRPY